MNPIKTSREMLFELAGFPGMAGGGAASKNMYKLITEAIEKYTKLHGRPPSPEDVAALKAHAKSLEPTPIRTDPTTQARARYEMATDPNLQNPDMARDPFLTKMLTGRTVKGTYLKPKTVDITDPSVRQSIDERQVAGKLDDVLQSNAPSITPGSDYIARMATGVENDILGSGKVPLIDKLKQEFYKQNKRFPTQEELDAIIAEFNPARHQYGAKGAAIVGERPASRVGQEEWRANARMEGIPEAYLNKPPSDYPQYLRDELQIQKGTVPGMKEGGLTAEEMRAMMIAQGQTPSKFKYAMSKIANSAPAKYAGRALAKLATPVGAGFTAASAYDTGKRLSQGDYLGAANSGMSTIGNAMSMVPLPMVAFPGAAMSMAFEELNDRRDKQRQQEEIQ